jgi:hypothetical protein
MPTCVTFVNTGGRVMVCNDRGEPRILAPGECHTTSDPSLIGALRGLSLEEVEAEGRE